MTNVHLQEAAAAERRSRRIASIVWGGLAAVGGAFTVEALIRDWKDGALDQPGYHFFNAAIVTGFRSSVLAVHHRNAPGTTAAPLSRGS